MAYVIKECFLTLQGEGARAGSASVFCRFIGCNLWSGLEKDRAKAICKFCDTDFRKPFDQGGGRFSTAAALAQHIDSFWTGNGDSDKTVVFTGGEPLLQLDETLIRACQDRNFKVAVETNGTIKAPDGLDWICVSPKANAPLKQMRGHELKLVYPQEGLTPEDFESLDFEHFFLQPMDCATVRDNTQRAVAYCQQHPKWRLSLQTHKWIGIP